MASIGRLDVRISASSVAPAWMLRASWTGYATALRLQRHEIDEIDVISHFTGVSIPGRPPVVTAGDPFGAYADWAAELAAGHDRHWREDIPFTFDIPDGWRDAPPLARALAVLDSWSRQDNTPAPWLAFPKLLRRMNLTRNPLPCLVTGDPGLRFLHGTREAQLKRLLKSLRELADEGLRRLGRLEGYRMRYGAAVGAEHRPGHLPRLGTLALETPFLAARTLVDRFDITLSGAGKLLSRAAEKGLLVETSGRTSWRLYVTPDVGIALGIVAPPRGRPPSPSRSSPALDTVLAEFDREMAEIDQMLSDHSRKHTET